MGLCTITVVMNRWQCLVVSKQHRERTENLPDTNSGLRVDEHRLSFGLRLVVTWKKLDARTHFIPFLPAILAEGTAAHAPFKLYATCSHITNLVLKMVGKHNVISVPRIKQRQQRNRKWCVQAGKQIHERYSTVMGWMECDNWSKLLIVALLTPRPYPMGNVYRMIGELSCSNKHCWIPFWSSIHSTFLMSPRSGKSSECRQS